MRTVSAWMRLVRLVPTWTAGAALGAVAILTTQAWAMPQGSLNLGSDGSDGAFVFVQDTGPDALANTMTIDLGLAASGLDGQGQPITWATPSPVAGRGVYDAAAWAVVFKYSSVTVPLFKTVRFKNHPAQAPVVWLVDETAEIQGTIDVSGGEIAVSGASSGQSFEPGPGGFRGGPLGIGTTADTQYAGFGPGGGSVPTFPPASANVRMGNHAGQPGLLGPAYGSNSAFPLLGGSGAPSAYNVIVAGNTMRAGGGGGGALLLAADTSIVLGSASAIRADGGLVYWSTQLNSGLSGAGGTIRLVTASLTVQGAPSTGSGLFARSGRGANGGLNDATTGIGRIRIEANSMPVAPPCVPTPSLGVIGPLFPSPTTPRVWVESVSNSTQTVPVPADPRAGFSGSGIDVAVVASDTTTLTIRAANVEPGRTCEVRITRVYGPVATYTSSALVGTLASSIATVVVPFVETGTYSVHVRVVL